MKGSKEYVCVCACVCVHMCVCALNDVQFVGTPWTVACQAPLSVWGIFHVRILEWFATPGDLSHASG